MIGQQWIFGGELTSQDGRYRMFLLFLLSRLYEQEQL